MSIGKRKTSGENLGRWDWDFRIGQSVFEDRVYVNKRWEAERRNVENDKFRAVFDMENIQVGWIAFVMGEGLNAKLVRVGEDYGARPSEKHNEGLRLLIKTDASLGDEFHNEFLAHAAEHPGCLPAADIVSTRDVPGSMLGPIFAIAGWVPRPFELPVTGIPLVVRAKKVNGGDVAKPAETFERPAVKDELSDEIPF
jgi:hypothetical protein